MIPSDIKLYTWIDVEDVFLCRQKEKNWPVWLISAQAYFDGLHLGIMQGHQKEAQQWLAEQFSPRIDMTKNCIILESSKNRLRELPIYLEETDDIPPSPKTIPTLARPSVLLKPNERKLPLPLPEEYPPVIAFHSFKGGVGRTLHALSLALTLTKHPEQEAKVLLIDGDLEAPGLTWLLHSRIPNPSISFVDLLTLVHGDPDPLAEESIQLAAERIKDMLLDGIYVLPAFRAFSQFNTLEVKPEHLIKSSADPYIMKKILAELGKKLQVDAVIIDLRAGLSELSTGLLLDPGVHRVIVSTLSAQSIEGTILLLKLLYELENPKREDDPLLSVIITQIPKEDRSLPGIEIRILETANVNQDNEAEKSENDETLGLMIMHSPFDYSLLVLPDNWDDMVRLIAKSELPEKLNALKSVLPIKSYTIDNGLLPDESPGKLDEKRKKLAEFSKKLIYAETSNIAKFLSIAPLRNLATDFRNRVPIALVVGAKGAGKTYTYLQIALRGKWNSFVKDAIPMQSQIDAVIVPILHSKNFVPSTLESINSSARQMISSLGLDPGAESQLLSDYLRDNLKKDLHEGQWRDCWLNVIAWRCGFKVSDETAGKKFCEFLKNKDRHIVGIIDGLEDLFQNLSSKENEQTALRALLQDVPEWLEQQPYRHLGFIVFVRQDMVFNSVKQNPAQLISKYSPYILKWDSLEALRLVAWISSESGILGIPKGKNLQSLEKEELTEFLFSLWGRKLGSVRSNEARSAEWVISVLSDLKGSIQARDIVRLLQKAANQSQKDIYWRDRILIPRSIRDSVDYCSKQKIAEIEQENPALGEVFKKLKTQTDIEKKKIPFTREEVKLETGEIAMLENNGVIIKEEDVYYMPEIFRWGLEFKLKRGARPRVIYLQQRANK